MPRAKRERNDGFYDRVAKQQRDAKFAQSVFVQRELNDDEKKACKAWDFSPVDALEMVEKLIEQNYKVTFRWDERSKSPACWIIAPPDHPENSNMILSGRGSEAFKALKQAAYKAIFVFDNGPWGAGVINGPEDFDD